MITNAESNKHWATSWHLLDNPEWRRGGREGGRAQCRAGGTDHRAPHPPLQGSLSMIDGHIWSFFVSSSSHTHLHLPPMVLSFQLTKHLNETRVSSYAFEDCRHTPATHQWEQDGCVGTLEPLLLCEILYESSTLMFLEQRGDVGAQRCCHGNEADLDPSVLTFYYLPCCFICKSGQGQGISIFLSR